MMFTSARRAGLALAVSAAAVASIAAAPASALQAQPQASAQHAKVFTFALGTTEPAIYKFIETAHRTLDMTMYELNDTTVISDLIAKEHAGVTVRVILDSRETYVNAAAYATLKAAGVGVVYSNPAYYYTHQKTITVDGDESLILTGNLTSEYYTTSRDYGIFDTDAKDVAEIETVFNADYAHTAITPTDADDLLWSPTDSRARILSVINGAKKTLDVEEEEFSDPAVVSAIVARAKAGVKVRVVLEYPSDYASEIAQVKAAGGAVTGYSSSTGFYVHAKAIVADAGLNSEKLEIGSINITSNSLDNNRELGIILTDHSSVNTVESVISADFAGGTPA
jgi:phosphatidylserine/phosphatidylglycerophosphate/cardiolipin synthase-like enzyme